jgi:antitoxin (DNA-binding transcriptional repressor) of toxin-antitoxin stability system
MRIEISSTEAARNLGECLARIRHRGDRFILTKNRRPVAELGPVSGTRRCTLRALWTAMRESRADEDFARDLERVNASDAPLENPWR